jgi:hypothetical protein
MAGLVPAISLRRAQNQMNRDHRDTALRADPVMTYVGINRVGSIQTTGLRRRTLPQHPLIRFGVFQDQMSIPITLARPVTPKMLLAGAEAAAACLDESSVSFCELVATTVFQAMQDDDHREKREESPEV